MISLRCSKGLNALYTDLPRIVVLGLICTLTWGFPGGSAGKESTCSVEDLGSIPGSGSSPGEGNSYPLQYSWASLVAQLVESACNEGDLGSMPGLGRFP